jgi:PAS domain S-box-containing protein
MSVLKNKHFGIFSIDSAGRFTFVNDVAVKRTGYTRDWFLERNLLDFVRPECKEEVRRHIDATNRGAPMPPLEFSYNQVSGNIAWVQVNTTPIRVGGRVVGVLGVLMDITKRKNSEHALKESEEKFRILFENSKDAIFFTDSKWFLKDMNGSFLKLFGYDKGEITTIKLTDLCERKEELAGFASAISKDGCAEEFELKLKRKDGSLFDCFLTGSARVDAQGTTLGYLGIIRDITEQNKLKQTLFENEQKLANIVQGSPIPQFVIDNNHMVTHWNKALEAASGIKAEEVVGTRKHWKAFYPAERPCLADLIMDATEQIPEWYRDADISRQEGGRNYRTIAFFDKVGGRGKWLCFFASLLKDLNGNIIGAVETLHDVTEFKVASDALKKALETHTSILDNTVVIVENSKLVL